MSNNERLKDLFYHLKLYSRAQGDEDDIASCKKLLKKEYKEYPGMIELFDNALFTPDYINRLYEDINRMIFKDKILYGQIIQNFELNGYKYSMFIKFLLDSIDNIPIEEVSSDDQSSNAGDVDDEIFYDCINTDVKFEFKPNQIRGIENSIASDFASGLHSQATGTGKTIMMLNIMWQHYQKYPMGHMMWFCERKDIPKKIFFDTQNIEFYRKNDIIDLSKFIVIDFINDKPKDLNNYMMERKKNTKPFIIVINRAFATSKSTYWKLDRNRLYKYQEILGTYTPKFIAFDECHSSMAPKTYEFLEYAKRNWLAKIQGMSATPYRKGSSKITNEDGTTEKLDNRQKLLNIFHKESDPNELNIISWCNIKEAIESEYILEPIFHWFSINKYYSETKCNNDAGEINSVYTVLNETLEHCPYKKVIVWCKIINNTNDWYQNFNENKANYPNLSQITPYIDHSKIDEESSKYDEFYYQPNNAIMFCANKYREGSDIPNLDCELFLDKVRDRTEIVYIQSIGRVLRKDKNNLKKNGHIIDSFNNEDDNVKIRDIINKILKYYFDLYEISFNTTKNSSFEEKSHAFSQILKNLKIEPDKKEISILLNNNKKITIDLAKVDISTLEWSSLMKEFKNVLTLEFEFTEDEEFRKLRKEVHKHGFMNHIEYKNNVLKLGFETFEPDEKYKLHWKGWYDFLGINTEKYIKTLNEWIEKVNYLKINTVNKYFTFCNMKEYSDILPMYPEELYKSQGFKSLTFYFNMENEDLFIEERR